METLIQEILTLSGPLPDAAAHQHYLETLSLEQLRERRAALNHVTATATATAGEHNRRHQCGAAGSLILQTRKK